MTPGEDFDLFQGSAAPHTEVLCMTICIFVSVCLSNKQLRVYLIWHYDPLPPSGHKPQVTVAISLQMSDNLACLLHCVSFFACKSWRMRAPKQDAQLSVRHQFATVYTQCCQRCRQQ